MNKELVYSKYKQRVLTPFFSEELLFDYLKGKIDDDRKEAIEKAIASDRKVQSQLESIQRSLELTESLAEIEIEDELLKQFRDIKNPVDQFLNEIKFSQWPFSVRWGAEVLVVLTLVSSTLYLIPWSKFLRFEDFSRNPVAVLAELEKPEKKQDSNSSQANRGSKADTFADEAAHPDKPVSTVAKNSEESKEKPTVVAANPPVQANPSVVPPVSTGTKVQTEAKPIVKSGVVTAENKEAPQQTVITSGFLYRGYMSVKGIEMSGPKITEKITQLGGRKAGEVDLGWNKTPTILYYHFTIPESKLAELESVFKEYGKLKLSKERHPRAMPEGIIRFIVEIEEAE